MILGADVPAPNALDRKRMADEWNAGRGNHVYIAVTESRIARGVLTAIGWFTPATPKRPQLVESNLDKAVREAESRRSGVGPKLRALLAEAERKMRMRPRPNLIGRPDRIHRTI
jgi:hypothetical protein